ncbi:MAG: HlyD family efflux transporter periplasmic adaptor subunit [Pirellulaceae bacterium]
MAQVAALEKEIRDINIKRSEIARFKIKAPSDGTLIRVNVVDQGKAVKEGDELFTIGPQTWKAAVELWVSGHDVTRVQQGDRVRLEFEGWPTVGTVGFFGGEVLSISPGADDAGMFRVLIKEAAKNSWPDDRYLRPGVRVNCWVVTGARQTIE